jgi:acetyl-CoA carboxylase biotin carboxyl carrier protein
LPNLVASNGSRERSPLSPGGISACGDTLFHKVREESGIDHAKTGRIASAPLHQRRSILDLKEIKELIALMRKNDLSVFKMEKEGFKITLKKGADYQPVIHSALPAVSAAAPGPGQSASGDSPAPAVTAAATLREITSPMVGTFYSAPSPESPAYVSVGQEVSEDTVVCIIEAMKVMNEIKAECRGTIAEIVAENGKPVQFGQPLFRVK